MSGFLDRTLVNTGWYYVDELGRYDLLCEIDECRHTAFHEVGSEHGAAPAIHACYMHISFAIEDILMESGREARDTRLKTIGKLKKVVPSEKKNGFEYD